MPVVDVVVIRATTTGAATFGAIRSDYRRRAAILRVQATRGDKPAAITSYGKGVTLNPKTTAAEIHDHETALAPLAALT